jgi:hypothetical protein
MTGATSPLPALHRAARDRAANRVQHARVELARAGDTVDCIDSLLAELAHDPR